MSTRASTLLDIDDKYAALQFDDAVTFVGRVIENALHEQVNMGDDRNPDWKNKYTLAQVLADDFRFPPSPKPLSERDKQLKAIEALRAWAKMSKAVKYIKKQ